MSQPTGPQPLVLVVEEDAGVRRFLDLALSSHGFQVKLASNGLEALRDFADIAPTVDLVLMDVQMAEMDGAATLLKMKEISPAVLCCFMTGDSSLSRSQELKDVGAAHIFSKPFNSIHDLIAKMNEVLNAKHEGS